MASVNLPHQMQHASSDTASINSGGRGRRASEFAASENRGRGMQGARSISISHTTSSMSPANHHTPVRSFVQRSIHFPTESSFEANNTDTVRADTAELASRAIEDDSVYSGSPASRLWDDDLSTRYNPRDSDSIGRRSSRGRLRRDAKEEQIRNAIHEESEPPSPEEEEGRPGGAGSARFSQISGHNNMGSSITSEDSSDPFASVTINPAIISQPHERTPLIKVGSHTDYDGNENQGAYDPESSKARNLGFFGRMGSNIKTNGSKVKHAATTLAHPSKWDRRAIWTNVVANPVSYLPAVMVGLLLNVLDALSYGMILFPLGVPMFSDLGPDGISMFYVSCIVSQLVFSCGGSGFKGGIGSEMIEVVPFFHTMAFAIMNRIGEDKPKEVLATTILAYSFSSIISGLAFFLLGSLKLGSLIGFFPRHILIGCVGGVGFFLVLTGLEVGARLEGSFEFTLETLQKLVEPDVVPLWTVPLALAVILFFVKSRVKSGMVDTLYFFGIAFIFYIVVLAVPQLSVEGLREKGWIFEAPQAGRPWWHFYTLYNFEAVDWEAFFETFPAMLALTFFSLLHVPINVPALAMSTDEDNLDLDRELRAHGYSNALSGLCGSIQNYLVYANTLLFMRAGANSRLAGVMLAAGTAAIMFIGPVIIGFVPVPVVSALIFFLGIDLLREAFVDPWHRTGKLEYLTIVVIVLVMGIYDFVVGIGVGIIFACVSFVFQTSQVSAVRGALPGSVANSTVRRHPIQRHYLNQVGGQIYVMRLAGYLFFGTIVGVEDEIRKIIDDDRFSDNPISFLVLDFSQVDGVDYSAAEALARINRMLSKKSVSMIMCGYQMDSSIGRNLSNVGLIAQAGVIEFFTSLNPALEYCENEMLKAFYQRRDLILQQGAESSHNSQHRDVPQSERQLSASFDSSIANSPRQGQMHRAATTTLVTQQDTSTQRQWQRYKQPLQLILQTFSFLAPHLDEEFWTRLVPYLVRETWPAGSVLYHSGDPAVGFYLLQSGILKAEYEMAQGNFSEVIVAGATCGELPFFGEERRTSRTVAERDSVTWVLKKDEWVALQEKDPQVATELLKIGLKLTNERMQAITKYMLLLNET